MSQRFFLWKMYANILNSGFSNTPFDQFVQKVMAIIAALTGNPNFPTTNPTVANIQSGLNALTAAMAIPGPSREAAVGATRDAL